MSLTDRLTRIHGLLACTNTAEWAMSGHRARLVLDEDIRALVDVAEAARDYVAALAEVTRVYDAGEMTVGDAQAICESKTDALVAAVGEVPDATH